MIRSALLAFAAMSLLSSPLTASAEDTTAPAPVIATLVEATTIQADDHTIGSADAPHDMIVYASVTCGHCGSWFTEEWPTVKSELVDTGKLRVAFREFPTAPAQVAIAGFMIANCGPAEGWWDHVVGQMNNQDAMRTAFAEGNGREVFQKMATDAGLADEAAMQACFTSDAAFAPIERSIARAEAAQLSSVPSFVINGDILDGAHNAPDIAAALK